MVVAAIFSPPPLERDLVVAAVVVASQAPSSLPLFSPSPLLAAATLPPALERVAAATAILPPALERVASCHLLVSKVTLIFLLNTHLKIHFLHSP